MKRPNRVWNEDLFDIDLVNIDFMLDVSQCMIQAA